MNEYLYRLKPVRPGMLAGEPTPEELAAIEEHAGYVKDLTEKGTVVLAGRTQINDESSFGIVVFRALTEASAREIMNSDPGVKRGIMRGELFPFKIAFMGKSSPAE